MPLQNSLWIGASSPCESPIISREFTVDAPVASATLRITALGFFEAIINGKPVTEYTFLPVPSDFEKRETAGFLYPIKDSFTHRVYYYDFDVSPLLTVGKNVLEIHLGNGWYRQRERNCEGNMCFGEDLKTIYRLDCGETTLISDGSESWRESEIRYNNIFIGEVQDKTFTPPSEAPVRVFPAPDTQLTAAIGAADKVIRTITPHLIGEYDGKKVYDAGENISGVVRVHTAGKRGEKIVLRFAENINADNTPNFISTGAPYICTSGVPQIMTDTFICDGTPTMFVPKFSWHAFRYFETEGPINDAEIAVIHSDCAVTSYFNSSSKGLNFLYEAYIRTQLDNMHGSVPTDCPHRERLGYTGDGQVCAESAMMLLDSREFYRKWIQDILDCQDTVGGHVQHTAPFMGGGGGPGGWGCAIVFVPYEYYKQYGDKDMLEACFVPMCCWLEYLRTRLTDGLVTHEEPDGWCLGDWCTFDPIRLPEPFVNTYFFVKALRTVIKIAAILGKEARVQDFVPLDAQLCEAIDTHYRTDDGHYCNGVDGADLFAWDLGLGDVDIDAIADIYQSSGYIDTGIFGTSLLFKALFANNREDTALTLLDSEKCGSFLYMKRHGATTLWEDWHGYASHCHPMFGASTSYLFTDILGITQPDDGCGYRRVCIRPHIPQALSFAKGAINTVSGKIEVVFKQENGFVNFTVKLPSNMEATFCFDGKRIVLSPQTATFKSDRFALSFEGCV